MPSLLRALPMAICLLSMAIASPAAAASEEAQFWITQLVTIRASPANSVTIDSSQRARSDDSSGGEQFLARVTLDHKIAPAVQIGGGMAYLKSEADQELRLFQQVTLARGIWLSRTRLEQRFFDSAEQAGWRLRQRVQAAVPLDRAKRWTLVAASEIFFHLNRARASDKTGLATMRHQIGLRHPVGKAMDVQFLYMRQQNFRRGQPDIVAHIPWLTLSWRI